MPDPINPTDQSQVSIPPVDTGVGPQTADPTVTAEIPPLPGNDISQPPPEAGAPIPPDTQPMEGVASEGPTPGSAAPSFDIPPVVTPGVTKKGGGKKVVATILGLLILVGGIGAGVVLVKQQQDIRERAAGPGQSCTVSGQTGTCTTNSACTLANKTFKGTSSGGCVSPAGQNIGCCIDCNSGTCYNNCLCRGNSATECRAACPTATATTTPACTANGQCLPTSTSTCCAGSAPISVSESSCSSRRRCSTSASATATTTPTAQSSVTCQTGQIICNGSCVDPRYDSRNCGSCGRACATGERCWENACVSTTTTQLCPTGYTTGGSNRDAAEEACEGVCGVRETPTANRICENATIVNAGTATIPNWCYRCIGTTGTQQPSPTAPPGEGPTAQCLNVKAYDTSWNQLSASQLSALTAGDVVRFTVAGTTTSGTFDKAKFKINGVQRPEVTNKKPGTEEFYDEYTIPSTVTSFTINAQIHHATLGWSE